MQHGLREPGTDGVQLDARTLLLHAADEIADSIRVTVIGMSDRCIGPFVNQTACATPQRMLNTFAPTADSPQCHMWPRSTLGAPCQLSWRRASAKVLSTLVSGFCYMTARALHTALATRVPFGLVVASYSATPIETWQPLRSLRECYGSDRHGSVRHGGVLFNSMIAPLTLGPMALRAVFFYQGESNVCCAGRYACALPSLITHWRSTFRNEALWFGVVQIAGYRYSEATRDANGQIHAQTGISHAAGDLRQAQLAALQLKHVGLASAIDIGHWTNMHPIDKGTVARRIGAQAIRALYMHRPTVERRSSNHSSTAGAGGSSAGGSDESSADDHAYASDETVGTVEWAGDVPVYHSSTIVTSDDERHAHGHGMDERGSYPLRIRVAIRGHPSGRRLSLGVDAPVEATRPSSPSSHVYVPRNACVTRIHWGHVRSMPQISFDPTAHDDCGWPVIIGHGPNLDEIHLQANASIGADRSSLILEARAPRDFVPYGSALGRAAWPMMRFYSAEGLPVLPWYANFTTTQPHIPPRWQPPNVNLLAALRACQWVNEDWGLPGAMEACKPIMAGLVRQLAHDSHENAFPGLAARVVR